MSNDRKVLIICKSRGTIPFIHRGPRLKPFVIEYSKYKFLKNAGYQVEILQDAELDDKGRVKVSSLIIHTKKDKKETLVEAPKPTPLEKEVIETPPEVEVVIPEIDLTVEEVAEEVVELTETDVDAMTRKELEKLMRENDIPFHHKDIVEELKNKVKASMQ